MSTHDETILELLNGLLDGVLTDDEQRRVDLVMKNDPSLGAKLDELAALRRSLLRGRSVGRLGPNFARNVVLAARERAEWMGEEAPSWISTGQSRSSPKTIVAPGDAVDEPRVFTQRAARVWIPSLAMVAVACVAMFLATQFWKSPEQDQPLAGDFKPSEQLDRDASAANAAAAELLANGSSATARIAQDASVATPNGTEGAPDPASETALAANATEPTQITSTDAASTDVSIGAAMDATQAIASNPQLSPAVSRDSNASLAPIADELASKGISNPILTLVAEIAIDPVARESDALQSLMEEYEILSADDLNLDQTQLDTLVDSRLIGSLSEGSDAQASGEVSVIFLRARATRIDAFLVALEGQYKDFPKYHYGMSMDPSVLTLSKQLSSIATNNDTARRLSYGRGGDLGAVTAFPAGDRTVDFVGIERRKQAAARPAPTLKFKDDISYLILIVRELP